MNWPKVSRGPFAVNALVEGGDQGLLILPDFRQVDLTCKGLDGQIGGMRARLDAAYQLWGQKGQAQPSGYLGFVDAFLSGDLRERCHLAGLDPIPVPPRNSIWALITRILCPRVSGDEQIRWENRGILR